MKPSKKPSKEPVVLKSKAPAASKEVKGDVDTGKPRGTKRWDGDDFTHRPKDSSFGRDVA